MSTAAACFMGSEEAGGDGGVTTAKPATEAGSDAGTGEDAIATVDGGTCFPAVTPNTDGHSADYDCMAAGCHGPGVGVAGLLITVSGTLHDNASGGAPIAGATVLVTDALGKELKLSTSAQGIFWSGVSDGGSVPAGPQGTCVGGNCTTYASATGPLKAVVVSKCPGGLKTCASPSSGQCAACHATQSVHP